MEAMPQGQILHKDLHLKKEKETKQHEERLKLVKEKSTKQHSMLSFFHKSND